MNERDKIARALLAEALQGGTPIQDLPAAAIGGAPGAAGYPLPMPSIELETRGKGRPRVGGSLSTPLAGGDLALSGSYYRPAPAAPPDWSTMLRYQRKF